MSEDFLRLVHTLLETGADIGAETSIINSLSLSTADNCGIENHASRDFRLWHISQDNRRGPRDPDLD